MHPPTPVTQEAAEASATTIVRLQYPAFAGTTPAVATGDRLRHRALGGRVHRHHGDAPRGLRISIVVDTGHVEITTFP